MAAASSGFVVTIWQRSHEMDGIHGNYRPSTLCEQQSQRLPQENRCCTYHRHRSIRIVLQYIRVCKLVHLCISECIFIFMCKSVYFCVCFCVLAYFLYLLQKIQLLNVIGFCVRRGNCKIPPSSLATSLWLENCTIFCLCLL